MSGRGKEIALNRRAFTAALMGLGMQAVSADATVVYRPAASLAHDLLPLLRRYAKLPSPQCVQVAMPLLLPLGDFVPLLVELLSDEDAEMRLFAIDLLDEINPDGRTLSALIHALDDNDPLVRIWAASLVVEFGARGRAAIRAFMKWMIPDESMPQHRQEWFRVTAADAISRIDPSRTDILPVLLDALESRNPLCQLVACETLAELGRSAAVALPILRRLHEDDSDRQCFAEAVAKICGRSGGVEPYLNDSCNT